MTQPLDILKEQPRLALTEADRMYGAKWKVQCPACGAEAHWCRFRFDNGRELFDSMAMHAEQCQKLHTYAIEQHLGQPLRGGLVRPLLPVTTRLEFHS